MKAIIRFFITIFALIGMVVVLMWFLEIVDDPGSDTRPSDSVTLASETAIQSINGEPNFCQEPSSENIKEVNFPENCKNDNIGGCVGNEIITVSKSISGNESELTPIEHGETEPFVDNELIKVICGRAKLQFITGAVVWLIDDAEIVPIEVIRPGQGIHDWFPIVQLNLGTFLGFTDPNSPILFRTPTGEEIKIQTGSRDSSANSGNQISSGFGVDVSRPSSLRTTGQIFAVALGETVAEITNSNGSTQTISPGDFITIDTGVDVINGPFSFNEDFERLQALARGPFFIANQRTLLINAADTDLWNQVEQNQVSPTDAIDEGFAAGIVDSQFVNSNLFLKLDDCPDPRVVSNDCWVLYDENSDQITLVNFDSLNIENASEEEGTQEETGPTDTQEPDVPVQLGNTPIPPPPVNTPIPTLPPEGSFLGTWSGTTSQGYPITFQVAPGSIGEDVFNVQFTYQWPNGCPIGTVTYNTTKSGDIWGPPAYSFNLLGINSSQSRANMSGGFSTSTSATGSIELIDSRPIGELSDQNCPFSTSITWNASR